MRRKVDWSLVLHTTEFLAGPIVAAAAIVGWLFALAWLLPQAAAIAIWLATVLIGVFLYGFITAK